MNFQDRSSSEAENESAKIIFKFPFSASLELRVNVMKKRLLENRTDASKQNEKPTLNKFLYNTILTE